VPTKAGSVNSSDSEERIRRTVGAIGPPKDGAKDTPALIVSLVFWIAAVKVPDVALYTVGSRAVASSIIHIGAKKYIESILLEGTNRAAEESSTDEEQEVGHDIQENGES